MNSSFEPESVVKQQLMAYNRRDLDALLRVYADDAELYEHPATFLAKGTEALRKRFELRFREPNLQATLLGRIVMGSIVIDHEEVTRTFPEGPGKVQLTMIYEIKNGRIARTWSISGPKTLDTAR
jgi:putative hydrolase of HD superfamily